MLKKLGALILLTFIILNSFSSSASANTYTFFDTKGYYDYIGSIGNNKITLSIYYNNNKFKGTYIYDKYRKAINIDGKINDANKITLYEYDNEQNVTGTFIGTLNKDDTITGTWKDKNETKKYKYKLQLVDILSGSEYGHRYDVAGFSKDTDVIEFVERIQKYVKNDDSANLSKLISYPVTVTIDGKNVEIKSKKQFVKNYNKIFTTEYKNTLLNAYASYLFANWQGIMVGSGAKNIWINNIMNGDASVSYITTINN